MLMSILEPGTLGEALDWDSGDQLRPTPSLSIKDKKLANQESQKPRSNSSIKDCKKNFTGFKARVSKIFEPNVETNCSEELVKSDKLQ